MQKLNFVKSERGKVKFAFIEKNISQKIND